MPRTAAALRHAASSPESTTEAGATPRVPGQFAGSNSVRIEQGTTNIWPAPIGVSTAALTNFGTNVLEAVTFATEGIPNPVIDGREVTTGFKVTYGDAAALIGITGGVTIANTQHALRAYVYMPSAVGGISVATFFGSFTGAPSSGIVNYSGIGAWGASQRIMTPAAGDLTGDFFVSLTGTPLPGSVFYITGIQYEAKSAHTSLAVGSLGTGYSWSGTPHASSSVRAASRVQMGTAGLDPINGGIVASFTALRSSSMIPAGTFDRVFTWGGSGADTGNSLGLSYHKDTSSWLLERYESGSSVNAIEVADTFAAGDTRTLTAGWDAGNLYLQIGTGARASAVNARAPVINATLLDVGQLLTANHLNATFASVATFSRPLTQPEGAYFAARTQPPKLGEHVGDDMISAWNGSRRYLTADTRSVAVTRSAAATRTLAS